MTLLESPVKTTYVNPIEEWFDKNNRPQTYTSQSNKYERGMLISISNNEMHYENLFKSFKEFYISFIKGLTGKSISKWDVKVLKGDWYNNQIQLPTREQLLRVVVNRTPILVAGVHNYKRDDVRSKGREYFHSHFYLYNVHHYLPSTPKELRDCEDKIERHLARYTNTRKRIQGSIRITPVGTGEHQYTDKVSPLTLYDYLKSPITNPQANNVINYIANNRYLPEIKYPLTTIYHKTTI